MYRIKRMIVLSFYPQIRTACLPLLAAVSHVENYHESSCCYPLRLQSGFPESVRSFAHWLVLMRLNVEVRLFQSTYRLLELIEVLYSFHG